MLTDILDTYKPAPTRDEFMSRCCIPEAHLGLTPPATITVSLPNLSSIIFSTDNFKGSMSFKVGNDYFRGLLAERIAKIHCCSTLKSLDDVTQARSPPHTRLVGNDAYWLQMSTWNSVLVHRKRQKCHIAEFDGLYLNHDAAFVLEAKSGKVSLSPDHILKNILSPLKELYGNAYYIISAPFDRTYKNDNLNRSIAHCAEELEKQGSTLLLMPYALDGSHLERAAGLVCNAFYIWKHVQGDLCTLKNASQDAQMQS